jgi:hypothetical protein
MEGKCKPHYFYNDFQLNGYDHVEELFISLFIFFSEILMKGKMEYFLEYSKKFAHPKNILKLFFSSFKKNIPIVPRLARH